MDDGNPLARAEVALTADELHRLSRALVYVVTGLEQLYDDLHRGCDPKRDAWVLAQLPRVQSHMDTLDRSIELLAGIRTAGP